MSAPETPRAGGTVQYPSLPRTGINWTPDMIARAVQQIATLETDAGNETFIADALAEHVDEHRRSAMNAKTRAKDLRDRMQRDGVA